MNGYDTDPTPPPVAETPPPEPAPDVGLGAPAETQESVSRDAECLRSGYLSWPCL